VSPRTRLASKHLAPVTLFAGVALAAVFTTIFYPGSKVTPSDAYAAARPLADRGTEVAIIPRDARVGGHGVIEPAGDEVKLALEVGGRLAELRVREGDRVDEGAALARLDDETERASLRSAESDVLVAQAELARARRHLLRAEVDALAAEAAAAKARASLSADALARAEALFGTGAIADADVVHARREAERDRAQAVAAEARREAGAAGARAEDIAVAQAKLVATEARRDVARVSVERRTLRAPRPGVILQTKLRVGEHYSPEREPLMILGDTSELVARVDIDERDVEKVALGARAFVTVPARPGQRLEGVITELGRRMGRKNVRSDDPVERIDSKVLEIVVALESAEGLVPGLRVVGYVE
jgi:HlyD family secretion protein